MYLQRQVYRDAVTLTRDGTYKVDLPDNGLLSFVLLEIGADQSEAPYQAGTDGKWRIVDFIDDISVIADGRHDVVTVPGTVAEFAAFLDQGVTSWDVIREYWNAGQSARFLHNFGRYQWDPDNALPLGMYDNVELNVTTSFGTSDWSGASISVYLGWLRDTGLPPGNRVRLLELWRSITSAQGETEYLELPTAREVRRIILQVYPTTDGSGVAKTSPGNVVNNLKLSFKNGQIAIWEDGIDALYKENYEELGLEQLVQGSVYHAADHGFDVGLADVRGAAGVSGARDGAFSATVPTREGDRDDFTQKMESYEADSPFDYIMRGCGYQNCGVFRFDRYPDGRDLLDPSERGMGTVELEIYTRDIAKAASGTIRVILDRLATPSQISI